MSAKRFYLVLTLLSFTLGGLALALLWGAVLDFSAGQSIRGCLGLAAWLLEFGVAGALLGSTSHQIAGPHNFYTKTFVLLGLWLGCVLADPLRYARAYWYWQDSRPARLVIDLHASSRERVLQPRQGHADAR